MGIPRPFKKKQVAPVCPIRSLGQVSLFEGMSDSLINLLRKQSRILAQETKETHWIDKQVVTDEGGVDALCHLERLAWNLLQHYTQQYGEPTGSSSLFGAEWWVQVKPVATASIPLAVDTDVPPSEQHVELGSDAATAIDLHFDKDEALAETFLLGRFPAISTVSYLLASQQQAVGTSLAPTIVLGRRYGDPPDQCMEEMLVSHPETRKHLAFDGRLLHGAPGHHALRRGRSTKYRADGFESTRTDMANATQSTECAVDDALRITFLVNIWIDHQPAKVKRLHRSIRTKLFQGESDAKEMMTVGVDDISLVLHETIPSVHITAESNGDDLPEPLSLPFVGGNATWGDEGDDEVAVVSLYPPPEMDAGTLHVKWDPEVVAQLEYFDGEMEDEEYRNNSADGE